MLKTSKPVLAASSWLSVLLIALMFTGSPSVTQPVYGFGGEEEAGWSQGGQSILDSLGRLLGVLRGEKAETVFAPDATRSSGAGKLIALQAGHWRYAESPPPFDRQTGGSGGGKTEPEVTLDIATRTAKILEDWGYTVEILPAWFAEGYAADAVVAIHSDGADNPEARGFFADRGAKSTVPDLDDRFVAILDEEYAKATDLPFKYRGTANSRYYYGFDRVKPKTPMILIETGFLSNEQDREIIVKDPDRSALGIANGVDRFLQQ